MTLSFVAIGMFVALVGFSIGLDQGFFRFLAALMLLAVGAVLVMPVSAGKAGGRSRPDERLGR
jgi:cytochrome c-type biogenesis protein